ncbi:MAG: hypothetical protein ACRDG4_11435 [Chloroflexota bacterium]
MPWDVHQSIQRRVRALPEPARPLLTAAAVIGRVAPLPLLTAVLDWPEDVVLDALDTPAEPGCSRMWETTPTASCMT